MRKRVQLTGLTLWLVINITTLDVVSLQPMIADDETPPFSTLYKWKFIDFQFPTTGDRRVAISSERFIPKNVIPMGIEVWELRVFISMPKWRVGVPASLATVPKLGEMVSPPLQPYPNWEFHTRNHKLDNCSVGLVSVFRVATDSCGRLWVLDSGQINIQDDPVQICPPRLVVFDLETDLMIAQYSIPSEYVLHDSLFTNLVVHSRGFCSSVHVYITDTWRYGLIVFRQRDKRFWRFTHNLFFPDPLACNYYVHDLNFRCTDGISGLALSPQKWQNDQYLFFHPMSSNMEFFVKTSVLQNYYLFNDSATEFSVVGESRGRLGQASASAIDRQGIMFFGLVCRDSISCWNTKVPYEKSKIGIVAENNETLVFPYDIKIDNSGNQMLWVLSNRLPMFQAETLDMTDYNFRLLFVNVNDAVRGTVCDTTDNVATTVSVFGESENHY